MVIATNDHPKAGPTEVSPKATRRRFTAKYKLRILREADACTESGDIAALLRREGLYSSLLTTWRKSRERGEFKALSPKKRGPKSKQVTASDKRITELERENSKLRAQLERAQVMLALQKKVAELLGTTLPADEEEK